MDIGRLERRIEAVWALGAAAYDESDDGQALRLAIDHGDSAWVVEILAERKPYIDGRDGDGHTPLMRAAWLGQAEIVRILIAHDADIDAVEPYRGQSSAWMAAWRRHEEAFDILVGAGAQEYMECCPSLLIAGLFVDGEEEEMQSWIGERLAIIEAGQIAAQCNGEYGEVAAGARSV